MLKAVLPPTTTQKIRRSAYKPGFVPCRGTAAIISLARRLPGGSSGLPESVDGPGRPSPPIWPCSRWGLPSQPVTRLLVRSYIKALRPAPFHPYRAMGCPSARRYAFCCTFPVLADGGRYPPPCPVEPGLSSPRLVVARGHAFPSSDRPAGLRTVYYTRVLGVSPVHDMDGRG